jgi:hypothetical protein
MRFVAAEDFAEQHSRQNDVVGKLRLARTLGTRINLAERLTNYI